uniref:paxillin isoform X1 n=1 Tax=Ciona intestinalis TaxID=7719 RepID=UPI00089DD0A1|nr:paxillin isoform X1 [Ciona intestinalis]|eukprot:XP_018670568.1 paxillin isoform X1 [Ciona intestinalis]
MYRPTDALLQDLEATIPPPVGYSPTKSTNDDVIFPPETSLKQQNNNASSSTMNNPNLNELDMLLEELYMTEAPVPQKATIQSHPPTTTPINKPLTPPPKKKTVDIDNILDELEETEEVPEKTQASSEKSDRSSPTVSATSAAQQLDDLMASLVGFQVDQRTSTVSTSSDKSDPPYAKPDKSRSKPTSPTEVEPPKQTNPNDLDAMLKDMNTDLVKQGIRAASKGICGACGKPVMGEVTTALGKVWHPEHFVCVVCDNDIGTKTFFERDGKPYCEKDYHKLFSPTCAYCVQPVLGQCVTALNKTWHPEHFFCAMCSNFFGDEGFHEFEGKPYCRADYYNMFAPKCGGCMKPILTNYISALNAQWHPECFVCRECLAPFTNGSFFELDGQPYCETHYHLLRGSLCSGCQKPITGRCITAMGKKFHPEHFVCAFCLKQLNKGTFKEQNDKPYCHQCFSKLYGLPNVG